MSGYDAKTLKRAKTLRREMTLQEHMLWSRLRDRQLDNFKFRKQQPLGPFIADFVCQEKKLIVEADGSQHSDSAYDTRRDQWLKERGYTVLRFWNNEINENLEGVLVAILDMLSKNPSPISPKQ